MHNARTCVSHTQQQRYNHKKPRTTLPHNYYYEIAVLLAVWQRQHRMSTLTVFCFIYLFIYGVRGPRPFLRGYGGQQTGGVPGQGKTEFGVQEAVQCMLGRGPSFPIGRRPSLWGGQSGKGPMGSGVWPGMGVRGIGVQSRLYMLGRGPSFPIWLRLGKALGVDHCPVVCRRWRASRLRLKLMLDRAPAIRKVMMKDLPHAMAWLDSKQDVIRGISVNVQRKKEPAFN